MKTNTRKTKTNLIQKLIHKRNSTVGTRTGYYPRHIARSIAKENMKKAGVQRINHHFSTNWRNFVLQR